MTYPEAQLPVPLEDADAFLEELEGGGTAILDQAVLLSVANRGLRALAVAEFELHTLTAAAKADVAAIAGRWEVAARPLTERVARIERVVLDLIVRGPLQFPPGKKSLVVEAGQLGRRKRPMRVEVTDAVLLEQFAHNHQLHDRLYEEKRTWKLDKTALDRYVRETGDVPDGCTTIPERDEPFAKPNPVPPDAVTWSAPPLHLLREGDEAPATAGA
jgi:hypothetical protein